MPEIKATTYSVKSAVEFLQSEEARQYIKEDVETHPTTKIADLISDIEDRDRRIAELQELVRNYETENTALKTQLLAVKEAIKHD